MKVSLLLILILAIISVKSFAQVTEESTAKLGILPFAEIDFASAKIGDKSGAIAGFTIGAEYTVFKKNAWSTNSKLSLKSFSKDNSSLFYTNKIETNAFLLGQTINYDTNLLGYNIQPFSQIEVGYGSSEAKSSFNFVGTAEQNTAKEGGVMAEAAIGARAYLANNFVPYVVGGYRYYELNAMKSSGSGSLRVPTKADFTSAYGAMGIGYQF